MPLFYGSLRLVSASFTWISAFVFVPQLSLVFFCAQFFMANTKVLSGLGCFSWIKDCYYPISLILTFSESLSLLPPKREASVVKVRQPVMVKALSSDWVKWFEKQRREWGSGGGWGRGGRKGGWALYRLLMDKSYLSPPLWMWISESRRCSLEPYWHCIVKSLFRRDTTTQSPCDITSPEETETCQCICMYASNLITTVRRDSTHFSQVLFLHASTPEGQYLSIYSSFSYSTGGDMDESDDVFRIQVTKHQATIPFQWKLPVIWSYELMLPLISSDSSRVFLATPHHFLILSLALLWEHSIREMTWSKPGDLWLYDQHLKPVQLNTQLF